jgi:hypothetical protein
VDGTGRRQLRYAATTSPVPAITARPWFIELVGRDRIEHRPRDESATGQHAQQLGDRLNNVG